MSKIEELYDLYLDEGLLTEAVSFSDFKNADENQRDQLYSLAKDNNLISEDIVDFTTFDTAWGEDVLEGEVVPEEETSMSTDLLQNIENYAKGLKKPRLTFEEDISKQLQEEVGTIDESLQTMGKTEFDDWSRNLKIQEEERVRKDREKIRNVLDGVEVSEEGDTTKTSPINLGESFQFKEPQLVLDKLVKLGFEDRDYNTRFDNNIEELEGGTWDGRALTAEDEMHLQILKQGRNREINNHIQNAMLTMNNKMNLLKLKMKLQL